jgi:3-oxoacyl-[acyl-carrier protein] reductase
VSSPAPSGGRLAGKVAVVTGSSGGIGLAIATQFAREGAAVVVNSRERERAERAAAGLAEEGHRVLAFAADTRSAEQVQAMAEAAESHFGGLDVWVNNAGVNAIVASAELPVEDWDRVIATNLSGCFYGSQAAARLMLPRRHGVIIQIGSVMGELGLPRRAAYTAAKHGLIGLTKTLGAEWAADNVRVVCLDPGYIRAGLGISSQKRGGAFTAEDIERRTPMHRFGEPEEVARVAVFLASDDASFITGSHVTVDGGWLAYGGW